MWRDQERDHKPGLEQSAMCGRNTNNPTDSDDSFLSEKTVSGPFYTFRVKLHSVCNATHYVCYRAWSVNTLIIPIRPTAAIKLYINTNLHISQITVGLLELHKHTVTKVSTNNSLKLQQSVIYVPFGWEAKYYCFTVVTMVHCLIAVILLTCSNLLIQHEDIRSINILMFFVIMCIANRAIQRNVRWLYWWKVWLQSNGSTTSKLQFYFSTTHLDRAATEWWWSFRNPQMTRLNNLKMKTFLRTFQSQKP